MEQSIFLGYCSDEEVSFYTLLNGTFFPHYNNTKIIKICLRIIYFMRNVLWTHFWGLPLSFVINRASELWKSVRVNENDRKSENLIK